MWTNDISLDLLSSDCRCSRLCKDCLSRHLSRHYLNRSCLSIGSRCIRLKRYYLSRHYLNRYCLSIGSRCIRLSRYYLGRHCQSVDCRSSILWRDCLRRNCLSIGSRCIGLIRHYLSIDIGNDSVYYSLTIQFIKTTLILTLFAIVVVV